VSIVTWESLVRKYHKTQNPPFRGFIQKTPSWDNYHGYNNTNSEVQGNPGLNWTPPIGSDSANFQQMVREINNLHQSLGALRTANTNCKLVHVDNDNAVFAYKRWDYFGCILLIVINISDAQWERREYQLNTDTPNSKWREVFNSQYYTYGGWVGSDNSDPSFYPSANNSGWLQGINVPKWSLLTSCTNIYLLLIILG
jgi:hypothetical protein